MSGNETDLYRPRFHFTPVSGWMNDPNGLVYYQNEYHLFYQYIPDLNRRGALHWGHAVSADLVHWRQLPVAIYPDNDGEIWSGSIVVDRENTAGFHYGNEKALIALFTQTKNHKQKQGLAFSIDKGRNWDKYIHNPVIPNPGLKDFRDPKVFWYEQGKIWVMVLAAGDRILFYNSPDLKNWERAGEFGFEDGSHEGVWECPDLFCLKYENISSNKKWVLLVSVTDGAPNGGSGIQYFIGSFDGKSFTNDYPPERIFWLDYGRDNYAAVSFSDIPAGDGRRILMGWMSNWQYARDLPTYPWKGTMTLPRSISLVKGQADQPILASVPVRELKTLRKEKSGIHNQWLAKPLRISLGNTIPDGLVEVNIEYEIGNAHKTDIVFKNSKNDFLLIHCDHMAQKINIDRSHSGRLDFHHQFAGIHSAELILSESLIKLHIFVDRLSAEIFLAEGQVVFTELIFPRQPFNTLEIRPVGGNIYLQKCDIWLLNSTGQV